MTSLPDIAPLLAAIPASASRSPEKPRWLHHARQACLRIPPLWPLRSFVAVNPFTGLADRPFAEVCQLMQQVTHSSMIMSADYFHQQFSQGRITFQDLDEAVAHSGTGLTTEDLLKWLKQPATAPQSSIQSLADIATVKFQGNWNQLITEEVSKWCAAWFDEGQSAWRMPWQKRPLYTAWKQASQMDAAPELMGFKGFRQHVASLPDVASEAIPIMLDTLGLNAAQAEDYLHRLLMTVPGWSSYAQYHAREKSMHGSAEDETLLGILAIRLVFETSLLAQFGSSDLRDTWLASLAAGPSAPGKEAQIPQLWQTALEAGFQRQLCARIKKAARPGMHAEKGRPAVQAVFCIDVRSETMRRSLESVASGIETLGFAGFFGMPIEYVPYGQRQGISQLPVLFAPKYRVREHLPDATPAQDRHSRHQLQLIRRTTHSWNAFKTSAVSCFSFVEAAGIPYAWKLLRDSFQLAPKVKSHTCNSSTAPCLHHHHQGYDHVHDEAHPEAGIPPEDQVQLALGALKNMGLTRDFARLVMLCGHGSHTTNNPYAASLDCGACGGHAGDPNARVAAALLNQASIRAGLESKGICIPDDTHFIAARHDTTTDQITLFDTDQAPSSHEMDLHQLHLWLDQAAHGCRSHRAAGLGIGCCDDASLEKHILQRSRDWAQVRPEWGLVANAAFIVAPRERTQGLNLQGRVFLHNYNHETDTTKSTLELIMTAPMIVTNWINLQYYASTVNNRLWGSGSKVTHNIVGTFGIQQGNGGDLRAGLPMQSLHNGETWMHEPLRLSVFIEAPCADIDAILTRHENVRHLVENGWLHLYSIQEKGKLIQRRKTDGTWLPA